MRNVMLKKRHAIGLCVGVASVISMASRPASASTITVQNLSQDTATGTYQYAILFDSDAYVKPGDGFVIYGFPGLTTWSLSGTGVSGSLASSGTFAASNGPIALTESAPSNGLTDGNAEAIADAHANNIAADNGLTLDPTVENLSFVWQGSPAVYTGNATATLTLDTSVTKGDTASVYASVDRSGTIPGTTYGTAEGTVFVPGLGAAMPEPVGAIACAVLLTAAGLRRSRCRLQSMKNLRGNRHGSVGFPPALVTGH